MMNKDVNALCTLSKLISPAINDQKRLRDLILSNDICWNDIIDCANQNMLIPALYDALHQHDLLKLIEEKLIVEYLFTVYELNRVRSEAILVQTQKICHLFSQINVTPVLLKGVAVLGEGYYHTIGARVMIDIDILVPENDIIKCIELLESKGGYRPVDSKKVWTKASWETGHHHCRRIYHEDGVAPLELHRRPTGTAFFSNTLLMKYLRPSKTIENAYIIEPTFEVYHSFLHSEISHQYHKDYILELRNLHHAVVVATVCEKEMDWDLLTQEIERHKLSSMWSDYIYMLRELFEQELPDKMLGTKRHFKMILYFIEKNDTKKSRYLLYAIFLKDILSYKSLKKRYNFKSKLVYPLVLIYYLISRLLKFGFLKEGRKTLADFFVRMMDAKRYGGTPTVFLDT